MSATDCLFDLCFLLKPLFFLQGDANRSYSDDDRSSSNFDESEKHDSIKLSGELFSISHFKFALYFSQGLSVTGLI